MIEIDLNNLPVFKVRDYRYENWFKKISPNGLTMTVMQRRELIYMIDSHVASNAIFLDYIVKNLKEMEGKESDYQSIERVILNAWMFTAQTTVDSMVACKYFLLADTGYDRRYMRGKLKVILNEGIKKLVGFKPENQKETVWGSINGIKERFTGASFQKQYVVLDNLLRKHASQSTWWKEERDAETHLDARAIYALRKKEIDESTVIIESLELTGALDAVSHFLQNLNAVMINWLNEQYRLHPEMFSEE